MWIVLYVDSDIVEEAFVVAEVVVNEVTVVDAVLVGFAEVTVLVVALIGVKEAIVAVAVRVVGNGEPVAVV